MTLTVILKVVDCIYGRPAADVPVRLYRRGTSQIVAEAATDERGSCRLAGGPVMEGYRIVLDADRYFAGLGIEAGCPDVTVTCPAGVTVLVLMMPFGHGVQVLRHQVDDPSGTASGGVTSAIELWARG